MQYLRSRLCLNVGPCTEFHGFWGFFLVFFWTASSVCYSVPLATDISTFQTWHFYPLFSKDTELTQSHRSLPPPSLPDKQLLNHLVNSIKIWWKRKVSKFDFSRWAEEKPRTVSAGQGLWQSTGLPGAVCPVRCPSLPLSTRGTEEQSTGSALLCPYTREEAVLRDYLVGEAGWHKPG